MFDVVSLSLHLLENYTQFLDFRISLQRSLGTLLIDNRRLIDYESVNLGYRVFLDHDGLRGLFGQYRMFRLVC